MAMRYNSQEYTLVAYILATVYLQRYKSPDF